MKHTKILSILLCLLILTSISSLTAFAAPKADFNVGSDSAVLMDLTTGQILYSKNPDKQQSPAGLVKVAAALHMLDKAQDTENGIDAYISVSEKTVNSLIGTNVIGLVAGEGLTLREALYGMLLQSANDCAVAAAETMSGSTDKFISEMNEKLKSLGCKNTNFSNVTGLYSKDNYTTASDVALIMKNASEDPNFVEIAGTTTYNLAQTNKMGSRTFYSRCPLLSSYEYALAGAGGYTDEGRYTMAVTASNNNLRLVAVVMNAQDEKTRNDDLKNLLDYGFENYQSILLAPEELNIPDAKLMGAMGKIGVVTFDLDNPVSVLAPIEAVADELEFQPQKTSYKKKDDMSGVFTVLYNGTKITELNLTGTPKKKFTFYSFIKTVLLILLALIVLVALLVVYYIWDDNQKKKKRRQLREKRRANLQ